MDVTMLAGTVGVTVLAMSWAVGFLMGVPVGARMQRERRRRAPERAALAESHTWALLLDGDSTYPGCAVCGISREEAQALDLPACGGFQVARAEWRARDEEHAAALRQAATDRDGRVGPRP